jgi:hypothetical protein
VEDKELEPSSTQKAWMENAYQNEFVNSMKSMNRKLIRAVSLATWVYSLLFLIYLTSRLTINASHVQLDDLFIDHVPFFTFLVTGLFLLVINLASLALYLRMRTIRRQTIGSKGMRAAGRTFNLRSRSSNLHPEKDVPIGHSGSIGPGYLNVKALIIWLFSMSIWSYLTYLSLTHPPSPPYWPISMMMFVISYICMVYMITARDSRVEVRSA